MTTRARTGRADGFGLVEAMVVSAVTVALMGTILSLVDAAQRSAQVQDEAGDMHQRLRAMVDAFAADISTAGGDRAPLRPYRVGVVRDDAAAGVYYRSGTLTVYCQNQPLTGAGTLAGTRTYYARPRRGADGFDLMRYDGGVSDLPLADHLAGVAFDYFGVPGPPSVSPPGGADADLVQIDPASLTDGPWWKDAQPGRVFDADLVRIRAVGVTLRIRAAWGARLVPDIEVHLFLVRRSAGSGV